MHPPFFHVDHKIGPDIDHLADERPVKRRGAPARLALPFAVAGWPPLPAIPHGFCDPTVMHAPSGAPIIAPAHLRIVPPPRRDIRDLLGRWLIRTGQRMILSGRTG